MPLLDALRALLGAKQLATEANILSATDARSSKLLKDNGLIFSNAVQTEIETLVEPGVCSTERAAYYLGVQMGWRAAQRFR